MSLCYVYMYVSYELFFIHNFVSFLCKHVCFSCVFYNNLTYLLSLKSISNGLKLGRLKIESLFESVHATESHSSPPFEANCLLNAVKIWKIADLNNKPAKHRTKLARLKSGKCRQVTQTQIYIWILILTDSAYAGLIMSLNMHPISHLKSIYQKSFSKTIHMWLTYFKTGLNACKNIKYGTQKHCTNKKAKKRYGGDRALMVLSEEPLNR